MRAYRFLRQERGAAAVEFAIVAPILVLFIFAIIDFGRLLASNNRLTAAVREGARAGAVGSNTTEAQVRTAAQTKVANYINGAEAGGTTVSPSQVIVDIDGTGLITVSLNVGGPGYPFTPITPFAASWGLINRRLNPRAIFRWELAS